MRVITLTIMDDGVYRGLRHHAHQNGRSIEEEAAEGGMDDLELPPRHCCEYNCSNWQQGCQCNSSN